MWEDIQEHEQLVQQLVAHVQADYEKHRARFFDCMADAEGFGSEDDPDGRLHIIGVCSVVLCWTKRVIIDRGGSIFNSWIRRTEEQAIYYSRREDIEILMSEDFIIRLLTYVNTFDGTGKLYYLSEKDICHRLITILERVKHSEEQQSSKE